MAGLGIGIAWLGYSVFYYGVTQIQGGNWGLLDLMIPSRWANASGTPTDSGSSSSGGAGSSGGLAPGGKPEPAGNTNTNGQTTQKVGSTSITAISPAPGMPFQK